MKNLTLAREGRSAAIALLGARGSRALKPTAKVPSSTAVTGIRTGTMTTPFFTLSYAQGPTTRLPEIQKLVLRPTDARLADLPTTLLDLVHKSAWSPYEGPLEDSWGPDAVCAVNAAVPSVSIKQRKDPPAPKFNPRRIETTGFEWHAPGTTEVVVSVPVENYAVGLVLSRLLGAGGEFTTGGPGRGSLSILALCTPPGVLTCSSFLESTLTGPLLLGVQATADESLKPDEVERHARDWLDRLACINEKDLTRAKSAAKLTLLLESDDSLVSAVQGGLFLLSGDTMSLEERLESIESVTLSDVLPVARRILEEEKAVVVVR